MLFVKKLLQTDAQMVCIFTTTYLAKNYTLEGTHDHLQKDLELYRFWLIFMAL